MVHTIPTERKNSIKALLISGASYSKIKSRLPGVGTSTISRLKKQLPFGATGPCSKSLSLVSEQTQRYIARLLRNGELDGPKAVQEYLKSIGIEMTVHGIRKMLKRMGFKAKKKVKTNFVSNKNKAIRLLWCKKHQHLTVDQWRKWVFSDETRVNMWGSDGNSYYWSDNNSVLLPHQIEPHVQGDGGSVIFWACITANGPGYGTTVSEGSVNAGVYTEILETSLLDTLEYYCMDRNEIRFQQDNATPHTSGTTKEWFRANGFSVETVFDWPAQSPDLNPIEHVWYQVKRRLNTYPTRPTTTKELEARITTEWYSITNEECLRYIDSMPKRIDKVINAKGGPIRC